MKTNCHVLFLSSIYKVPENKAITVKIFGFFGLNQFHLGFSFKVSVNEFNTCDIIDAPPIRFKRKET